MRKLLFLAFICLSVQSPKILAQTNSRYDNPRLEDKTSEAEAIVEGAVIETKGFQNEGMSCIYTSATIKISKIFKGEISDSTIELIFIGGRMGDRFAHVSDAFSIIKGQEGMFFIKNNRTGYSMQNTSKSFIPSNGYYCYIEYHHDLANHKATCPGVYYDDLEKDLYPSIEAATGISKKILCLNTFEIEALKKSSK
jgi:hypothetical protein